jgi:ATP-binding cassette subfamily G (WHITE) protein 2 (SNQ2)
MQMQSFAEAIVGEVGSGLGVEERKKLTIGVELASKPSLLVFLDEPTSGLDSQSAWAIVQLLKRLASHGMAILCTIHQPSVCLFPMSHTDSSHSSGELFNQFDRLILLKRGGNTVYAYGLRL